MENDNNTKENGTQMAKSICDVFKQIKLFYVNKWFQAFKIPEDPWYLKELEDKVVKDDVKEPIIYGKVGYHIDNSSDKADNMAKTSTDNPINKKAFLVFFDKDNRVRYAVCDTPNDTPKDDLFSKCSSAISQLRQSDTFPIDVLSKKEKKTFKIKLANGFAAAVKGSFEDIQDIRQNAIQYAERKNRENTKNVIIKTATLIAVIVLILIWLFLNNVWLSGVCHRYLPEGPFSFEKRPFGIIAFLVGILGAYASLWSRYSKLGYVGHGTKCAVARETICRLIFGGFAGLCAYFGIKGGIITPNLFGNKIAVELIAFSAGFLERFVPKFVNQLSPFATSPCDKMDRDVESHVNSKQFNNNDNVTKSQTQTIDQQNSKINN